MNAPLPASLLSTVELAPRDPILGVTEAFVADKNPKKVNLGVGVYYDDNGKLPVLDCVKAAEHAMAEKSAPRGYLPIDGLQAYDRAVQKLLLGADSEIVHAGRAITVQALGGTGGLKVGADFLRRFAPGAQVWISDPSWENHRALFEGAGFKVASYPYYDAPSHGLNFAGMCAALRAAPAGTIVALHACCHNPTGVDMSHEQWREVARICKAQGLVPMMDIAYQGFGEGVEADAAAVRLFAAEGLSFFVASSFSKSFSLYGERVGALTIVTGSSDEAARVLSQLKRVIRTNYSNPPTHGGSIVAAVLADPKLRALWEEELAEMRNRIKAMRKALVDGMQARGVKGDFSYVLKQNGMFSYSGLTPAQVDRLRNEFGIYAVSTGRVCVAALNSRNIDYVCDALAKVLQG
jgi:aromatic-amino-acid transaminase